MQDTQFCSIQYFKWWIHLFFLPYDKQSPFLTPGIDVPTYTHLWYEVEYVQKFSHDNWLTTKD